ncbi:MAG: hypothetical protein FWB95_09125 [Treponema sp.]|nr:hypothetical protein [Treponema sp.]
MTEQTKKNEVCTFSAIGKSKDELLAYDELDSEGDGNYFTDDVNMCSCYSYYFHADRAINDYEKINKTRLKKFDITITKVKNEYNIEISDNDFLNPETKEKPEKNINHLMETQTRTCQFYATGVCEKELRAYDGSYGREGYFFTNDIFLCSRCHYAEALIIALERKIKFFLVEIGKTDGEYKKEISEMEIPAEPPVGQTDIWNHSCALGGVTEGLSQETKKSLIKALKKHPLFKNEYFSLEKTLITRRQYSFLSEFKHYIASIRSGAPGHPPHENDFFARLSGASSVKKWEIYDCTFENVYEHCRLFFIINNNTVRQYIRFALEWNWGYHLYYVRETPDEGYISKKVRPEIQKIINKWYRPMEVTKNKNGSYDVSATAACKDKIYRLDINIEKTGSFTILRVDTLAEDVFEIDDSW